MAIVRGIVSPLAHPSLPRRDRRVAIVALGAAIDHSSSLDLPDCILRLAALVQFFQKSFQMNDSLIDALSFQFGEPDTAPEAECGIVGFLRTLDFAAPCSRTGG